MKKYFWVAVLILLLGCNNSSAEKELRKANNIYFEKGFLAFTKYVEKEKNKYFPFVNRKENGATPLLLAIKNKDKKAVDLFLEKGASLEEKDFNHLDIFDYALNSFDEQILLDLIDRMPREYWNTKDDKGRLPCIRFILNCDQHKIVEKILWLTDNLEEKDNEGKTLLMYAAQGHVDVRLTHFLLGFSSRIKINDKNKNEWTALMYAARYNPNPLVLQNLILAGADLTPNSVGLTLVMLAACNPNPGVLHALLKQTKGVNAQTDEGKTALMYACQNEQASSVIQILIDNQVDINKKDNHGKTALMYALESYQKPEIPYLLVATGADCSAVDNQGKKMSDYLNSNKSLKNSDLLKVIEVQQKRDGTLIPAEKTVGQKKKAK